MQQIIMKQCDLKRTKLKLTTIELLKKRMDRNIEEGGTSSITVAPPGEGKTNQLMHDVFNLLKFHPTELIFWRDNPKSVVQYNKKGIQWQILVERGLILQFHNLTSGGDLKIKYKIFDKLNDIVDQDTGKGLVKTGLLNVIYFINEYTWIDFMEHLRHTVGWQNIFIDEIEDLVPLNPSKRPGETSNIRYNKNLEFAEDFKELRKSWINFFSNTQNLEFIEPRIRKKVNFIIYLSGAKVEKGSKIWQGTINNLKKGYGYIDFQRSKYGKLKFDYYPNKKPYFEIIKV